MAEQAQTQVPPEVEVRMVWGIPEIIWHRLQQWALYGVGLALAPLFVAYFVSLIFVLHLTPVDVLKDGELFIISAVIAAAGIGELVSGGKTRRGYRRAAGAGCIGAVILGSVGFAVVSAAHAMGEPVGEGMVAWLSVLTFAGAVLGSGGCVALAEAE